MSRNPNAELSRVTVMLCYDGYERKNEKMLVYRDYRPSCPSKEANRF